MEKIVHRERRQVLENPQRADYNSAAYLQLPLRAEVEFAVSQRLWEPLSFPSPQMKVEMPERIEGTMIGDVREIASDITAKGKEILSRPVKRLKRRLIAGAAVGTLAFGGALFAPESSQRVQEVKDKPSVSSDMGDVWKSERTPSDRFDMTKNRWMKVPIKAQKAPPPPALEAELKPKPKPKPEEKHTITSGAELSLSGVKKIVFDVAKECGLEDQWNSINNIVYNESFPKWDPASENPTSHAGGLFQALPASKYGVGENWRNDPEAQAKWGVCVYMNKKNNPNGRYWDPNAAWKFWQANNWY